MSWEYLNKDNIEEVKQLYIEYLEQNKVYYYTSNLKTFEEFIETELTICNKCNNIITNDKEYCDCCYDEMFVI